MTAATGHLGGVTVGGGGPVVVMGALNVSPESFHAGSVQASDDALLRAATGMVAAGAAIVDIGARSTAPYGTAEVGEAEEADRLGRAVALLASRVPVPVSADTTRPGPAGAALDGGARILNDIGGLRDPAVARLAAAAGVGLLLMASPDEQGHVEPAPDPLEAVAGHLRAALGRVRAAGILEDHVVLDPGIGFFRGQGLPWFEWDLRVLAHLASLRALGRPLCVGVSRKSFLGAVTGRERPDDRLAGSLAATTAAVLGGAAMIRTHDVAETVDAVRVAERLRAAQEVLPPVVVRSTIDP